MQFIPSISFNPYSQFNLKKTQIYSKSTASFTKRSPLI